MVADANNPQLARIEQILQQLDASQTAKTVANRRHAQRHKIRTAIESVVLTSGGEASLEIFSRNVSTSGIGFVTRRLCKPGERIVLTLEFPGHKHKLVLAQITFCRYIRAGLYQAGAQFVESIAVTGEQPHLPSHWTATSQLKAEILPPVPGPAAAAAQAAAAVPASVAAAPSSPGSSDQR